MTAEEPRVPRHRFYQKQKHVKLARVDKDKQFIRGSGIDRIDGGQPPSDQFGLVSGSLQGTATGYRVVLLFENAVFPITAVAVSPPTLPQFWPDSFSRPDQSWASVSVPATDMVVDYSDARGQTIQLLFPFTPALQDGDDRPVAPFVPSPITGTPPVLAPLVAGETLDANVTWGTYSGFGTVTTQRQARVNGGAWNNYVGTTVVTAGQTWQLRERVSDDFNTNQVFLGNIVVVPDLTLDERVQAILAGRAGCAFDLGENANRFTDAAATIPVTAIGQPVQAVKSKWGTLAYTYSVANVAAAPVAASDALLFDGVDDYLIGNAAVLGFLNNVPAVTVGITFNPDGVGGGSATAIYFSRNSSATQNRLDLMRSTAALRFLSKRLDADANVIFTSAAGSLTLNQWSSALLEADFAGSGRMETWLDGNQLAGAAIGGTVGNSDALNSAQAILGAATPSSSRFGGRIRKVFLAQFRLTAGEKTTVQEWLEEA